VSAAHVGHARHPCPLHPDKLPTTGKSLMSKGVWPAIEKFHCYRPHLAIGRLLSTTLSVPQKVATKTHQCLFHARPISHAARSKKFDASSSRVICAQHAKPEFWTAWRAEPKIWFKKLAKSFSPNFFQTLTHFLSNSQFFSKSNTFLET
jgi:hypothetical protein